MLSEIISRTPVWVWGILLVILYFGIQQSKQRAVPKRRIAILPMIMIGLSLSGILSAFGGNVIGLAAWFAAVLLVLILSQQLKPNEHATFSPVTKKFTVPGSWLPLCLMMAIFIAKYIVAIMLGLNPSLKQSTQFIFGVSFVYGLLSSLFFARAMRVWATQKKHGMMASSSSAI
ncbi:MAG: hypothetical protein RL020_134 [Pseudomonadota bacterium]|jgi:hypothetical protein